MEDNLFNAIYNEYRQMVFRRCFSLLRNNEDAEDAVNLVFERFYQKYQEIKYPSSYLFRMATNMGIDMKRNKRKEIHLLYAEAANVSLNHIKEKSAGELWEIFRSKENQDSNINGENIFIDKEFDQVEAKLLVESLLNQIDDKTKLIYFLRYRDDMTYVQIGKSVGLSKTAVEKRIKKLEETLRKMLYKDKK